MFVKHVQIKSQIQNICLRNPEVELMVIVNVLEVLNPLILFQKTFHYIIIMLKVFDIRFSLLLFILDFQKIKKYPPLSFVTHYMFFNLSTETYEKCSVTMIFHCFSYKTTFFQKIISHSFLG